MNRQSEKQIAREEYRAFLDKANAYIEFQKDSANAPTPEQARAALEGISLFCLPEVEVASVKDDGVSMPDRTIPVRIYDPHPKHQKAVIIYMHGGGHMCGSVKMYDAITRRLAASTGQLVVSIDYRLAPEFPYPCGLDDCQAVVDNVADLLEDYLVDLTRVTLAGDSAGGALASTVAWRCGNEKIFRLLLIYPSLDYTFSTPSYETLATGYLLETEKIQWYFKHYFKQGADYKKASPLFFSSLERLPKTLILAAELDPLVDEGKLFFQRLKESGVDGEYHVYQGVIHCFLNLESFNAVFIDELYQTIAAFVE